LAHHLEHWADGGGGYAEREHLDDLLAHFHGVIAGLLIGADGLVVRLVCFGGGIFGVMLLKLCQLVREPHGLVLCSAKIRGEILVRRDRSFQLLRSVLQLGFDVDSAALRPHGVGLGLGALRG